LEERGLLYEHGRSGIGKKMAEVKEK